MMEKADKLIYEKSNNYRLHADNIRWSLLAGYAAFFAAIASLLRLGGDSPSFHVTINLLLFLLSNVYLLILAVQNWFYNLFAKFVKECESRLASGERLRPMEEFAVAQGKYVNPFHPAFFFAEVIVGFTSFYFLLWTLYYIFPGLWTIIPILLKLCIVLIVLLVYFWLLNSILFRNWDTIIYKRLIVKFSNLWQQPISVEKEECKKE